MSEKDPPTPQRSRRLRAVAVVSRAVKETTNRAKPCESTHA